MSEAWRDRTAIVGVGQTEFSKNSGRSEMQLASEAARAAIADAGLTPADIDGMVTFTLDTNDELELMRSVGITQMRWTSRTGMGGALASATVQHAAAAVASGAARAVLVYRAFNERSGRRFGQPMTEGPARPAAQRPAFLNWYIPYGLDTPAKTYGMWYQRYMHRFGVTNEDFGRYTVVCRRHASTNPAAWFYNRPITIDDHQNSRWIVEPVLRLLDCCQESDGGVALVVTGADRAKDLPNGGVRIAAATQSHLIDSSIMYSYYHPEMAESPEEQWMAAQLWEQSGISRDDIDVALIYENFSPIVFLQLEAYGFCGPGEAKDFIAEGHIDLDGSLPVNPHGGLLGEAYIHGVNNIIEGVRQVRGTAVNQVPNTEHALVAAGRSSLVLEKV